MSPRPVYTPAAPMLGFSEGTASPLSQAIVHNGVIYCSGSGPLDAETLEIVSDDIAEQTQKALTNLLAVVEAAGGTKASIMKVNTHLRDLANFAEYNRVYRAFFDGLEFLPARTTTESSPPRAGVLVEIECIAAVVSDE